MVDEFIRQLEKDIKSPEFGLADKILKLMDDGKTRYVDEIASILDVDFVVVMDVIDVEEIYRLVQENDELDEEEIAWFNYESATLQGRYGEQNRCLSNMRML